MSRKMPDEAYEEFKQVAGENNVSIEPEVLETYTYMNGLAQGAMGFHWNRKPIGVVLPSTLEEVRKILEICTRYGLKFKAHSTAWVIMALATSGNVVLLDMRRMNNLEINERDFFLITESYPPAGVAQIEAMKKGLQPHLVGAGPNASNLASATSMQGTGGTSVRTSMNERNVLAVEWVLPTGEVLKLGSINTPGAGWFCGDGPGPSLRGMMRGAVGQVSGNGVFTKVALKLYPWYGPEYKGGGEPPFFNSEEVPNSYLKYVLWDSFDDEAEGLYRLGEAEIIDYNNRWAAGAFTSAMTTSNQEYLDAEAAGKYKEMFGKGFWTFFMHAPSERSLKHRIKVFEKIVSDTGGEIADPMIFGKRSYEIALQNAVRAIWIAKAAYMPTSANTGSMPMTYENIDQCFKYALPISVNAKKEYANQDKILNEGADNCYACIDEDGHYIHIEHACLIDTWEPKGEPGGAAMVGMAKALSKGMGLLYMSWPGSLKDFIVYLQYSAQIQSMIDPNGIADSSGTMGASYLAT
ncbi:MAG: FAD-binding oxidoreductase [Actinobacteria bacterium]|nr:FAD-binding oxidoreductase [Actinomycetota bacterium]